jgi:site-specific recombinase XerD
MITIADLLADYEDYLRHERQLAPLSIVAYLCDLRALAACLGSKNTAEIDANDLRAHMRDLGRDGFKTASIRRKFHGFGTFWRWLKMEGYASDVITESLVLPRKPQRVVKWLNAHDLRIFVETPPDRANPNEQARDHVAWQMLAWLGLRRSELLNLDVCDVRLSDQVVVIRDAKGRKDRILPLPPALMSEITAYIGERESGLLFRGQGGTRWRTKAFNRAFQRHLRTCGLAGKGITPHTLRHTFATHLVMAGIPIPTVSKLLGHADIQSTMVYVHVDMEGMRYALAQHILAKESTLK